MFNLFKWFKKTPKAVPAAQETVVTPPDLNALDYPKDKYKVYWETHHVHDNGTYQTEVRFIGYSKEPHLAVHRLSSDSYDKAEQLAAKLIKEKMEDYKR